MSEPARRADVLTRQEIEFALAWEVHAPGLGGWHVCIDEDDLDGPLIVVDPPLSFDGGFELRRRGHGIVIRSKLGEHSAPNLRHALLLICPLSPVALAAVDRLVHSAADEAIPAI